MVGIINKYNKRDSSFELLRILCMLFVIGEHLIGKGMHFTYDNTLLGGGGLLSFKSPSQLLCSCCTLLY